MKLNSLGDLFVEQLKDVYNAEKQLIKALPKMAKAASAPELRLAFQNHLTITKEQAARLERIFEEIGSSSGRKKCRAMEGLIEEANELIEQKPARAVSDAGLVAAAQRVEHYEISAYGTLRSYATLLGHDNVVGLLELSLKEEEETDELLTQLAESSLNQRALEPDGEGGGAA